MNLTIQEITKILRGQLILGDPKSRVTRASVDSRLIDSGDIFFALKGEKADGHDFAMLACRLGATAVVVSKLDWLKPSQQFKSSVVRVMDSLESLKHLGQFLRNGFRGPVVGITGSNGKTTTKQMLASVLGSLGPGLFTKGNYNSQIGLPLVLTDLQPEHKWMTLEMGASEPGNIASLAEVARPTVGIITSIGPAHLKTFGSLKKIAESKWELMESLPHDGAAIVPWGEPMLEPHIRAFKKKMIFFGDNPTCPVRATAIEMGEKIKFLLHVGPTSASVTLPVAGRFNVNNALAAAAAGWVLGVSFDDIVKGLEKFEPPKMRMEMLHHSSGAVIVNDAYNANPASMIHSIRSLVETYHDKKKIVVIGTMLELGEDSEAMHFNVGTELGRFPLEKIYLFGRDTEKIREGAVSAGSTQEKFVLVASQDDLLSNLQPHLKPDRVLLFKGSRGVQLEKVIEQLMKKSPQVEKV